MRSVPQPPRWARGPPPPETLHICNSFDGMIAATVRAVGKGAEVAFETRRARSGEADRLFRVDNEPHAKDGAGGAGAAGTGCERLPPVGKEPGRVKSIAKNLAASPSKWARPARELNPPTPAQLPSTSSVARAVQMSSIRSEKQMDLLRSCSDFRMFDAIIADPPFKTLADLKVAWRRHLTGAEVRRCMGQPLAQRTMVDRSHRDGQRRGSRPGALRRNARYRRLWYHMVHPDIRGFFHTCRGTIASGRHRRRQLSTNGWMTIRAHWADSGLQRSSAEGAVGAGFPAHLLCVRAALDDGFRTDSGKLCDSDCSAIQQETAASLRVDPRFGRRNDRMRDAADRTCGVRCRVADKSADEAGLGGRPGWRIRVAGHGEIYPALRPR